MKRREAVRNVLLISAGAAWIYSCKGKEEDTLMADLTETIIPGIKELNSDQFVLMMSQDCLDPETQKKFSNGMKEFEKAGFVKMSAEEKREYIGKLDGDTKLFFDMVKEGTIMNFTTSQGYLKDVKNITTLIPPKFQACVSINS